MTVKPPTTDSIPNLSDRITQATTKHERSKSATPHNTVGSVWKAHDSMTRGQPITSYLVILIHRSYLRIAVVILDAATRSKAGTQWEGG